MILLIILVCVFGLAAGGFNYVYAIVTSRSYYTQEDDRFALFIGLSAVDVAMLVFEIILIKNPNAIFTGIHWVWILVIGILLFAGTVALGIYLCVTEDIFWTFERAKWYMGAIQVAVGILVLILMIVGLSTAKGKTYEVSSVDDLEILDNLPGTDEPYIIQITSDLDFEGIEPNEKYGTSYNTYIIEGNGHTISNIKYERTLEEEYTAFFEMSTTKKDTYNSSKIKNLNFDNCEFYITPNFYNEEKHEGKKCHFYLFGDETKSPVELQNVIITRSIVYALKGEENPLSVSNSVIGDIYPTDGENIDLRVIREE